MTYKHLQPSRNMKYFKKLLLVQYKIETLIKYPAAGVFLGVAKTIVG